MALDRDSVDRILSEVGKQFLPKKINRELLAKDIAAAADFYRGLDNESNKGLRTERRKLALQITKCCEELLQLLADPKHVKWARRRLGAPFLSEGTDSELPSFHVLTAGLRELRAVAERAARSQAGKSPLREHLELTPLMRLLGCDLVQIYRGHFQREGGRSRSPSGGNPHGPYIRFAIAVMRELGETISVHTVEAAIKRGRSVSRAATE
jgi:hypothetical protein